MEAGVFRQAENEIHVLDGLAGGAFDKIIYNADHMELLPMFSHTQDAFVGINDHLEVRVGVNHMYERLVLVVILIKVYRLFFGKVAIEIYRSENSSRKVPPYWNEIDFSTIAWGQGMEGFVNL